MSSTPTRLAIILTLALVVVPIGARQAAIEQQMPPTRDAATGARQPASTPPANGVLAGTVVSAAEGAQIVRRARVTLTSPGAAPRSVLSDTQGTFRFPNVPAGQYTLSASKAGHISTTYGQKRPITGASGTAIALAENQQITNLAVVLPRGAAVTGIVMDENGDLTAGTQVRALRYVWRDGERTLMQQATATTDDRGVYRIFGLSPGDYVIGALPRPPAREEMAVLEMELMRSEMVKAGNTPEIMTKAMAEIDTKSAALAGEVTPSEGYAPVYFPGTTSASSATVVSIGISEERTGIDFQLQNVPLARVDGAVLGPPGVPLQGVTIQLVNTADVSPGLSTITTRARPDGQFFATGVPPGQYLVVARATQPRAPVEPGAKSTGSEPLWATAETTVDGRAVSGISLQLQPGATLSGQLIFEGGAPRPPDLAQIRLSLGFARSAAMVAEIPAPQPARIDDDGRFTISGVLPGRYRFTTVGGAVGPLWRMGAAVVQGRDALDFPFEVKSGDPIGGINVTLTDKATELSGTLRDASGRGTGEQTVILFAADRQYWTPHSRRIFGLRPSTDGRFAQRTLAPGEYLLATVDDIETGAWLDPKFLEKLTATAIRVTVSAGEKKVQDLTVGR